MQDEKDKQKTFLMGVSDGDTNIQNHRDVPDTK